MLRLILLTFMLLMLLGGQNPFVEDVAYADCCMCNHWVRGCTPPGSYWNGQLCLGCARPDSEVLQVSGPYHYSPPGMRAVRELLPSFARTSTDGTLILTRRGQCLRRSGELRLLTDAGDGFNVYQQYSTRKVAQFQTTAQAD